MKKYEYASRTVFCKTQEDVDKLLNDEIYKFERNDVMFINITPYINPGITSGFCVPVCFYVSYVYRWTI